MDMISTYPKKALFIIIGLAILFLTAYSLEGSTMSFLTKPEEEVVLCSPMEGIITFKGEPAAGAKIDRWITWKDEIGETDTVYTDNEGRFNLPIKKETVKLNKLTQFVVHHEINVIYLKEHYQIWVMGKFGKHIYAELNGKPINFRCELTDEVVRVETDGLLGTSCVWDSIEKYKE